MSSHSLKLIYLNQSSTSDLQISNFFSWSIEDRPIRVFIEDEQSLIFWSMNDFFAGRLILISLTQHIDLISGFKTSQKFTNFISQFLNHLMKFHLHWKVKLWLLVNFFKTKLFQSSKYFKWSILIIKNQRIWKSQQKVKISITWKNF